MQANSVGLVPAKRRRLRSGADDRPARDDPTSRADFAPVDQSQRRCQIGMAAAEFVEVGGGLR